MKLIKLCNRSQNSCKKIVVGQKREWAVLHCTHGEIFSYDNGIVWSKMSKIIIFICVLIKYLSGVVKCM